MRPEVPLATRAGVAAGGCVSRTSRTDAIFAIPSSAHWEAQILWTGMDMPSVRVRKPNKCNKIRVWWWPRARKLAK